MRDPSVRLALLITAAVLAVHAFLAWLGPKVYVTAIFVAGCLLVMAYFLGTLLPAYRRRR